MATILIIESDPSVAALLTALVEVAGAKPVFAPAADSLAPDLLIMEPDVSGAVETASALRDLQPRLPIICVCSRTPTAELRAALEPAIFFAKPFAVAELHATLLELLQ